MSDNRPLTKYDKIADIAHDLYRLLQDLTSLSLLKRFEKVHKLLNIVVCIQLLIGIASKIYSLFDYNGHEDRRSLFCIKEKLLAKLKYPTGEIRAPYCSFVNKALFLNFLFSNNYIKRGYSTDISPKNLNQVDLLNLYNSLGADAFFSTFIEIEFESYSIFIDTVSYENYTFHVKGAQAVDTNIVISQLRAKFIESLAHSNIVFHPKSFDAVGIKVIERNKPVFYEQKLYNKMFTSCKNAIEKNSNIGFLLYGKPGVSKTVTVNKLVNDLGILTIYIDRTIVAFDLVIDFLQHIEAPKLLIFEDIDSSDSGVYGTKDTVITNLLKTLDTKQHNIVIMTSNSTTLPEPLIRSGRIDRRIFCDVPNLEERQEILNNLGKYYSIEIPEQFEHKTNGLSHADLETIIRQAHLEEDSPLSILANFFLERETCLIKGKEIVANEE